MTVATKKRASRQPATMPATLAPAHPEYSLERYTVATAARYLMVSRDTVYREVAAGRMAHRRSDKAGSELKFSQAALDAWRAERTYAVVVKTPALHVVPVPVPRSPRKSWRFQ